MIHVVLVDSIDSSNLGCRWLIDLVYIYFSFLIYFYYFEIYIL